MYNSDADWQKDHFRWLSEPTIPHIFLELEEKKIVVMRQSVKNPSDREKGYTLDYEQIDLVSSDYLLKNAADPPNPGMVQNLHDASRKNCAMITAQKLRDGSTESTTETTTEIKNVSPQIPAVTAFTFGSA